MRSRASSLPRSCWRCRDLSVPGATASSLRLARSASLSLIGWSTMLPRYLRVFGAPKFSAVGVGHAPAGADAVAGLTGLVTAIRREGGRRLN